MWISLRWVFKGIIWGFRKQEMGAKGGGGNLYKLRILMQKPPADLEAEVLVA
jgi:hypothetical protein